MLYETLKAPETVLELRRQALQDATRQFFLKYPDVYATVFIGSILYSDEAHDTDLVVISEPQFTLTTEEIDTAMSPFLLEAAERNKIYLPHPDTWSLEKSRRNGDTVTLGPFKQDYGDFVIGRKSLYFEPPSGRTTFSILRY